MNTKNVKNYSCRYFVDVREPSEYANSHVSGAINVPVSSIMNGAPELASVPKDSELILYCRTGNRSSSAMHYLRQLGYSNLVDGINQQQVELHYSIQ